MRKSWLLCVLLGTLAWGQAAPGTAPPTPPAQAPAPATPGVAGQIPSPAPAKPPAPAPQADASAAVPPDAAVITVKGVCPEQPKTTAAKGTAAKPAAAAKTPPAECKTVITKADFEKMTTSIPNMNPQMRKQLATVLPRLIALSDAARKRGLDKTPQFAELLKIQEMQLLSTELQRNIQQEAAKVSDEDIADYYKKNPEAFEQYSLERLVVPRNRQVEAELQDEEKEQKLTEEQQKAKQEAEKARQEASEQAMTNLAESLRARATAGEDFTKMQKEAYEAAGFKIEPPAVALSVRRTGLPATQASVFELKAGEVSQVINDSGGHYIYKMKSSNLLPLDQVKDEIHRTLQNQRMRDMMDQVSNSFQVETNEAYFGPGGAGPMPPTPRMPNPRMAPPPPPAPQAQPQTPPPAQPAAQPATKPN